MKKIILLSIILGATSLNVIEATNPIIYYFKKLTDPVLHKKQSSNNKIALISIQKSLDRAKAIIGTLTRLRNDTTIKGIIIHINCPGGIPGTSQAICSELKKIKKIKPIIVVIENQCTSGAYYVACAADFIFALPSSTVGSIGIISVLETYKDRKFHDDKFSGKVDTLVFTNGKYKNLSRYVTPDGTLLESLKDVSAKMYEQFVSDVADMRNLSRDDEALWAEGREIVGTEALELGLIDALGDFTDALEKMKELLEQRIFFSDIPFEIVDVGSF